MHCIGRAPPQVEIQCEKRHDDEQRANQPESIGGNLAARECAGIGATPARRDAQDLVPRGLRPLSGLERRRGRDLGPLSACRSHLLGADMGQTLASGCSLRNRRHRRQDGRRMRTLGRWPSLASRTHGLTCLVLVGCSFLFFFELLLVMHGTTVVSGLRSRPLCCVHVCCFLRYAGARVGVCVGGGAVGRPVAGGWRQDPVRSG